MPEETSPTFDQALESDMTRLAAEVQKHRENPEMSRAGGREIIKKSLQSFTTASPLPPSSQQTSKGPLPAYASSAPAEAKLEIEYLLDMALHHGIEKANAHAAKSSPFVMDVFHDALVTKLYPELKKRGIVE
jgi:hypothetical protein